MTARDRSRDHFTTKEERAEMWRQLAERREARLKARQGPPPPPKDYEILTRDDGTTFVQCPWGQELPPHGAEVYFWNILEELRTNLSDASQDEFLTALGRTDDTSRSLLSAFCAFALDAAKQAARERHRRRMEDIEEVRLSVGYYEDDE